MSYQTLLMASAAVLFSTQAMAQDLTGAFSAPGKGQITSETKLGMTRETLKHFVIYYPDGKYAIDGAYATETVEYGITDKLSINGSITNVFDKDKAFDPYYGTNSSVDGKGPYSYNNDHNFMYNLGAKYNTRFDDVLFQVAGAYTTYNPKDFWGKHNTDDHWQKNLGLDLKAGLDLGNGITPYIVYHIDSDIDTAHRELTQSVSIGIHKYTGKWALDGAIRYEWTKNHSEIDMDGDPYSKKNKTETWFDGAVDYYLKDNIALGLYGSYLIDAHDRANDYNGKDHINSSYELGLRVKVLF